MNMRYQLIPLLQVKDKLPSDSLIYAWIERDPERWRQELVAYFTEDTRLDSLDLDLPFGDDRIRLILVDGNLTVDRYIYNEITDGAAGLIVNGHLAVPNMLVGGQEIYVSGCLTVRELFWGDYNHGDLTVKGDAYAAVFADTDEYHVNISGALNCKHRLQETDVDELQEWLADELYEADEADSWLVRGSDVLRLLEAGTPLLKERNGNSPLAPEIELQKLKATITVPAIEDILALPLVQERYNDYYDTDKNGYWHGRLFFGFRLPEGGRSARLLVGEETGDDYRFFHYDIAVDDRGEKTVGLFTQEGNGHEQELRPIAQGDVETLRTALRYFERLVAKVRYDNKKYVEARDEQQVLTEAIAQQKEQFLRMLAEQEDLVDRTCILLGHAFRVITLKQADRLLNGIVHPRHGAPVYNILGNAWLLSAGGKPVYFLLAEESAHLPHLRMTQLAEEEERLGFTIAGFLFGGHLRVDTFIEAYDTDYSPPLIVWGDLTARNIALWGASFYVGGDVRCECLYGFYNHGDLIVAGRVEAGVVIADDFAMNFGQIGSNALISINDIYGIDKLEAQDGSTLERWTLYPSTYRARDILHDDLVDAASDGLWPNRNELLRRFEEGGTVVDGDKLQQAYASFAEELPGAFEEIFHGWEQADRKLYKIKADDHGSCYFYQRDEQEWQQAGFIDGTNHYILRVFRNVKENEWQLLYDVYNEQWEMQCQFATAPEDSYTSALAVKKSFREALQARRGQREPEAELLDLLSMGEDHPGVRQVVRLTDLHVPSGRIVAADPLANMERPAFARRTPVGTFPVFLYVEREYGRICCAEIRFSDEEIAAWEMALLPEQNVEELKAGEIYGYPVDAGHGCFMDEESQRRLKEHERQLAAQLGEKYDNYYDDYLSELLEGDAAVSSDYCTIVPFPEHPHNAAVFRSGWGDGYYASYFALNAEGQVVRLVTDFACLSG